MGKLIKITRIENRYVGGDGSGFADVNEPAYINPDAIVSVSPSKDMSYLYIHMGAGESDDSYRVTAEEWARIEPLLTGEPAPQESDEASSALSFRATWESIEDLMRSPEMKALVQAGKRIDAIRLYRFTCNNFKEAKAIVNVAMEYVQSAPAPTLPESVLKAYWAVSAEMDKGRDLDEDELNNAYMNLFDAIGLHLDAQGGDK
jgi:hypothetical protein